jgi:hypothetical protein
MEGVLEEAIEALRNLPEDRQERVGRAILEFALDDLGREVD